MPHSYPEESDQDKTQIHLIGARVGGQSIIQCQKRVDSINVDTEEGDSLVGELNEDGELLLVYEGLKQANRLYLSPQNGMLLICCFSY